MSIQTDVVPEPTDVIISDTLLGRQDYQTLLGLIERADLTTALQEDSMGMGWTLFAPSDLAFENDEFAALSTTQRDALIKGHLYSGSLMFTDLQSGLLVMTQGSIEIRVREIINYPFRLFLRLSSRREKGQ